MNDESGREHSAPQSVFAAERVVWNLSECSFYHSMDLPELGTVTGMWDLRATADKYLGDFDFTGKRCLDLGTASGFLTFEMERRGASEVVSVDIDSVRRIDLVPFADPRYDLEQRYLELKPIQRGIWNSYWLAHRLLGSNSKLHYGSVYDLPDELGTFDVTVLGMILPHLRDPLRALEQAARHTLQTLIVTQQAPQVDQAYAYFMPDPATLDPHWAWWSMSEGCVERMLRIVGFSLVSKTKAEHACPYRGDAELCVAYVAERAAPFQA